MLIENLEQLNELVRIPISNDSHCVLCIKDNKSNINIQYVVVRHPLDFIRNLNDFSKNLRLPVSDIDIKFIGYIDFANVLHNLEIDEDYVISPYVYFKKPEEVDVSVGSDASTPPVEV